MADINIDTSHLPEDVRIKLSELDLELAEGEAQSQFGKTEFAFFIEHFLFISDELMNHRPSNRPS